ncbi:MAG: polysaccharide deacetylase family protein [Betaproteobacteria bacterium]|nr:polysaccharide deacetylase family protein [Betaproteobacteria bacterium]
MAAEKPPIGDPGPRWRPAGLVQASVALHAGAVASALAWPSSLAPDIAVVLANHVVLMGATLSPRSPWLGPNWVRLPRESAARGEIALTIDDGPDPKVTPQVLDVLDRYRAKATFFCIGECAARHRALARELTRRGHAVENHSQRHLHYFSLLGPRAMARELEAAQETLAEHAGVRPVFFRAPAGFRNALLDPVLFRHGLQLASWTRRGFDTRERDPRKVAGRLVRGLQAGDILLLHDGHAARTPSGNAVILEALPRVLDAVAAAGLRSVTLREGIAAGTP